MFAKECEMNALPNADMASARIEAAVREQYERFRPYDTFADLKRRARYEKDSKGLLKHLLEIARKECPEAAGTTPEAAAAASKGGRPPAKGATG
jgi:hypothetical protein